MTGQEADNAKKPADSPEVRKEKAGIQFENASLAEPGQVLHSVWTNRKARDGPIVLLLSVCTNSIARAWSIV